MNQDQIKQKMIADIGFVILLTDTLIGTLLLYGSFFLGFPRMPYFVNDDERLSPFFFAEIDFCFFVFLCLVCMLSFPRAQTDLLMAGWIFVILRIPYYALLYKKINSKKKRAYI